MVRKFLMADMTDPFRFLGPDKTSAQRSINADNNSAALAKMFGQVVLQNRNAIKKQRLANEGARATSLIGNQINPDNPNAMNQLGKIFRNKQLTSQINNLNTLDELGLMLQRRKGNQFETLPSVLKALDPTSGRSFFAGPSRSERTGAASLPKTASREQTIHRKTNPSDRAAGSLKQVKEKVQEKSGPNDKPIDYHAMSQPSKTKVVPLTKGTSDAPKPGQVVFRANKDYPDRPPAWWIIKPDGLSARLATKDEIEKYAPKQ